MAVMSWYARPSWRLAGQLAADLFVLGWALLWWGVGRLVDDAVSALAAPAREGGAAARSMEESFRAAARTAGQVPGLGGELRTPFDDAAARTAELAGALGRQAIQIEQLGTLAGVLTFLLPVALLVVLWLPRRVAFARRSAAARRFVDSTADLDLFALRAMATMPLDQLARISDDPVAAWRAGDRRVIEALADTSLRKEGLPLPRAGRRGADRPGA
ncbi:hypothetical protein [Desertihabitans brevis]|nr:hypothetical protein [Desertihabitans brevis]